MTRSIFTAAGLLAGGVLLGLPSTGLAQDVNTPDPVPAPAGRLETALEGANFEVEINDDKPRISLALGGKILQRPSESSGGTGASGAFEWSASLSVPVGGGDDLTDPQTLDRLSNGTTLTVGISRYLVFARDRSGLPGTGSWQVSGEASVGVKTFDYRTPVTLAENSDEETSYSAEGFLTYYPSDFRSMVSFGLKYQHAFEAQDEVILCRPVVVTPADDCAKAPPGAPEEIDGWVISLEYRRTFDIGLPFGELGISPLTSYDVDEGEYGLELPVYLVPTGESPVLPGIKVGYSSDDDAVTFGLFLKSSFSLGR